MSAAMLHHVGAWENALAEAVRVLRPGGLLLGYALLGIAPARLLHVSEGHDTRLLRPARFEAELAALEAVSVRVRPGIASLVVRFAASKAP